MDDGIKIPKPLTEEQRNEVRTLLKQLSAVSASRRSKAGNTNRLSRKRIKKIKIIDNPFDGIDEGKTVNGITELSPDCITLPFVQRVGIVLLPYHYDEIPLTHEEWVKLIVKYVGCFVSTADEGTKEHIRFVVEGNAPVRYLHLYLEKHPTETNKMLMTNYMFAT